MRFGVLKTPAHRLRYLGQHFSDSGFGRTPDGRDAPVSITIRHHVDGGVVDVVTRRAYDDSTVADHMWSALTEFRIADPPEGGNAGVWAQQYIVRPRLPVEAAQSLSLDGVTVSWQRMNDDDLVALGTTIPGGFVAVAGPLVLLDEYAVELLPAV